MRERIRDIERLRHIDGTTLARRWRFVDDFYDGLARVENKQGKYGFISMTGDMVIPCKWESAECFYEGIAWGKNERGECFYINTTGKIVKNCLKIYDICTKKKQLWNSIIYIHLNFKIYCDVIMGVNHI